MEIFAQRATVSSPWVLSAPGPYTQIELFRPLSVTYTVASGSPPAPDTILPNVPAMTTVGPNMPSAPQATFDNAELWVIYTIAGSGLLYAVLRDQLDTLDSLLPGGSLWAVLGKVLVTHILDWQE